MKIVHVAPNYFDKKELLGGGERYALELAKAMSRNANTKLVTFGMKRASLHDEDLKIEIYPFISTIKRNFSQLLNLSPLRELRDADIIHCHQIENNFAILCILFAKITNKTIVGTDHGGYTSSFELNTTFHVERFLDQFLLNSEYCSRRYKPYRYKTEIIFGGINPIKFTPCSVKRDRKALFVGRLLPHKGVDYLIEGLNLGDKLHVVGMPYDQAYYKRLQGISSGKDIVFKGGLSDTELVQEYSSALVTILPSVERDYTGRMHVNPELLGLVLLESMACGTPVICTNTGSMPEIVQDGVDGFVVPPNDPAKIGERVNFLLENPSIALAMGENGRKKILKCFTWAAVAGQCLNNYKKLLNKTS